MPEVISRAAWKALPAKRRTGFDPATATTVFIHYIGSGSAPSPIHETATWRSIQYHHLNHPTIPYSDIAYSFGVGQSGVVYEGRGWEVRDGATRGQKTSWSFCWLGNKETPTRAAVEALRWLVGEARRRAGKQLPILGHRQNPLHPNETDCPGDILQQMIDRGELEPRPEENDVITNRIARTRQHLYVVEHINGAPSRVVCRVPSPDQEKAFRTIFKVDGDMQGDQSLLVDVLLAAQAGKAV